MTLFFTSDTHFGHHNIIKYDKRPFASTEEHDEALIVNWNSRVRPNDTVWHLGDFAFYHRGEELGKLFRRLNGKINFVFGNHDKDLRKAIKQGFVQPASVHEQVVINYKKISIHLNHWEMTHWDKSHYGAWHCFGHSHNETPRYPGMMSHHLKCDVGVVAWNYFPPTFEEIEQIMTDLEHRHLSGN